MMTNRAIHPSKPSRGFIGIVRPHLHQNDLGRLETYIIIIYRIPLNYRKKRRLFVMALIECLRDESVYITGKGV